jgi:uncharacterized protein (DUF433 family)
MATARDLLGFQLEEAARLAGLSKARLDRILATSVHVPSGESTLLSFRDLVALRTVARLKSYGVSLQRLRSAYWHLREYSASPWSELVVGVAPKKDVAFLNRTTDQWEAANATKQLLAPFSIAEVEEEMAAAVERDRKRKPEHLGKVDRVRGVMGGEECFQGTRIPVRIVRDYLNDGASVDEILADYPSLSIQDIQAVKLAS